VDRKLNCAGHFNAGVLASTTLVGRHDDMLAEIDSARNLDAEVVPVSGPHGEGLQDTSLSVLHRRNASNSAVSTTTISSSHTFRAER